VTFAFVRGLLVVVALAVAFVAGGVVIVPLAILAPPLPIILGGLLALYVLGATRSMADDWDARRQSRRRPPAVAASQSSPEAPVKATAAPVVPSPAG
jgi:hypothetical protein